ncbi:hypothetical protein V7068_19045 [Bacillus sp. JJ634]
MKKITERLKGNKLFRKTVQSVVFGATVLTPTFVLAATSPEKKYKNVIEGISELLIGLSIPAAILASIVYALMFKFASSSHRKAEIIDNIKGTGGILIFVLTAGLIMNWIAGLVQ